MDYRNLAVEMGPISTVTINRPQVLNAIDDATLRELLDVLGHAARTPEVRVLILTGAGEKAFIAGADISAMAKLDVRGARAFSELGHEVCDAMATLEVPVIAAVNGFALGGGTEMALACDFIYASRKAKFGQPEVKLGVIPGFGGTQRLARRVGIARAKELILGGELINADEALRIGLVNAVCEPDELMPRVRGVAAAIAARGPVAVAEAKRAIIRGCDLPLDRANELEREIFAGLFASYDLREGMAAFLQKREAKFEGR
jgi:enoyl-CoA hydratase